VVCLIVYTILFGESDFHKGGCIGWLHWLLTSGLCTCYKRCCIKVCGQRAYKASTGVEDYCCNKPNPFMQLFYGSLVIGGYYVFVTDGLPFIRPPYIPTYQGYFAHIGTAITLIIFLCASISDPGTINKSTVSLFSQSFPYDQILYTEKQCETCKITRPARSKHCRICNRCVSRFDHHCPWINNCVGEKNLKWFLSFLFSTAALCTYCTWMCAKILFAVVEIGGFKNMGYIDRITKRWTPLPYSYVLRVMLSEGGLVMPLGIFTLVLAVVVYAFWSYHIYLIVRNTTTNETYKWKQVKHSLNYWKAEKEKKEKEEKEEKEKGAKTTRVKKRGQEKETSREISIMEKKHLKNVYNQGIWKNFWEVIYPQCSRKKIKFN